MNWMPDILAIIPARAGSKRLPGKNMIDLGGRPLIAWTIEAAKKSGIFEHIFVSSDSGQIIKMAIPFGVGVHVRPPHWATGEASMLPVWVTDFLNGIPWHGATMFLQPTSPFRTSEDVVAAWEVYRASTIKSLVSVRPDGKVNGAIYLFDSSRDLIRRGLYGRESICFTMSERNSIDIDTAEDLERARAALNA